MTPIHSTEPAASQMAGLASQHNAANALHGGASLPYHGVSAEHLVRMAARRALVSLKQSFMRAADELTGPDAEWLRRTVRQADDSTELWRLRPTILAMLPDNDGRGVLHRAELNRQLDSIFPESSPTDSVPPVGGLAGLPPQLRPR